MPGHACLRFASSDPDIGARWNFDATGRRPIQASGSQDPFGALRAIQDELAEARRSGQRTRRAGFVSYEANRWIESLPPAKPGRPTLPTLAFWEVEREVPEAAAEPSQDRPTEAISRSMARDEYLRAVRRTIGYVEAGDIFQANLAHTLSVATARPAHTIARALHRAAPAKYGATVEFGDVAIISNSPELFFRIEPLPDGRRRITTRPIKGTRPRGPGMRDALERSEKDRAELAMIVDLERNDLGRVCEIGSVRVVEPRVIEEHPTVYHGVATVDGMLRPDVTLADVFRAMFPCGSITGCPKVRAMQIIDKLEPEPRGPYCGAIGYMDSDGSAEFSVAIRTMTLIDGVARVSVGGGIVADSDPAEEHRETITKARAMLRALGMDDAAIDALDG